MRLSIGMATFDDVDRTLATIQSLRQHHSEVMADAEIIVVDNLPAGPRAQSLHDFMAKVYDTTKDADARRRAMGIASRPLAQTCELMNALYIPFGEIVGTSAPRDKVFQVATGKVKICIDSHISVDLGGIKAVLDYYEADWEARKRDLVSGPMLNDQLSIYATHFDDRWRGLMWGCWARAWECRCGKFKFNPFDPQGRVAYHSLTPPQRVVTHCPECGIQFPPGSWGGHEHPLWAAGHKLLAEDPNDPPFEIPGMGLGFFAATDEGWPGFHPKSRGFGGEEMYIHEKVRRRGGKCMCLPKARWWHAFTEKKGQPYPNSIYGRTRNYVLELAELGIDLGRGRRHFVEGLNEDDTHIAIGPDSAPAPPPITVAQWDSIVNAMPDPPAEHPDGVPTQKYVQAGYFQPQAQPMVEPTPDPGYIEVGYGYHQATEEPKMSEPEKKSATPGTWEMDGDKPAHRCKKCGHLHGCHKQGGCTECGCSACECQPSEFVPPVVGPPAELETLYASAHQLRSDINEHAPKLRELASQAKHVTEFGHRRGVSTVALLAGQPETLLSFDPGADGEGLGPKLNAMKGRTALTFGQGASLSTEIESTDLLFIDTKHTGEHLYAELKKLAPKVRYRIAMHDTQVFGARGEDGSSGLLHGLKRFLHESAEGSLWSVVYHVANNNGFTVISRDKSEWPAGGDGSLILWPPPPAPPAPGFGPGTELLALNASIGLHSPPNCPCRATAEMMDRLGVAGCREKFDEIVKIINDGKDAFGWGAWFKAGFLAVFKQGLAFKISPTDPVPGLVTEAIRRAEAKGQQAPVAKLAG